MTAIPKQPWLNRAKTNLREFFDGKRKFVFQFNTAAPELFTGLEKLATNTNHLCDVIRDHHRDLENQLNGLQKRFEMGYEDDFVYSLRPYTGVGFFASAFGCKTDFPDIGHPITHPIITSIDQVDQLRVNIEKADLVNLTLDKIKYFLDQTHGEVPIAFPDLQSPINTASVILDYTELMCSIKTDPDKVHQLLKMITNTIEEILARVSELLPNWQPSAHLWLPRGISLSDDLMAVMSPQDYKEFALPYADRLSREYKGICLHSCGNPLSAIDVIRKCHKLMLLDFWEVTLQDFQIRGGDYPASVCVVEVPWHNLDRRAVRKNPHEAAQDALCDLSVLRYCLDTPVFFTGVCPHLDYVQEYYTDLAETAKIFNTHHG